MNKDNSIKTILPEIEHFVVVMFENRSFDNILGGLYPDLTKQGKFQGVKVEMSNLMDPKSRGPLIPIKVWQAETSAESEIIPYPDPGELFDDMNEQIFSPGKAPVKGAGSPSMGGFVINYLNQKLPHPMVNATMQYYAPGPKGNVPISTALAENYAVSDCWHASAPVQTLSNRMFVAAAQPSTYSKNDMTLNRINNTDFTDNVYDPDGSIDVTTVFERLDEKFGDATTNWKVYYHDWPLSAFTKYVDNHWHVLEGGNVYQYHYNHDLPTDYADFSYDVKHNSLPKYSFIEPRYTNEFGNTPNSNHPGGATLKRGGLRNDPPPIGICEGERLLANIYSTLASNTKLFEKTLLIVTYDEHGGLFDHVPPTVATPPNSNVANFDYSRFGVRVPAIFINPYIKPGTIFRPKNSTTPFDHTSIISTLAKRFGFDGITPRDKAAPTFDGIINTKLKNPFNPTLLSALNCIGPTDSLIELLAESKDDENSLYRFIWKQWQNPCNRERVNFVTKVEKSARS